MEFYEDLKNMFSEIKENADNAIINFLSDSEDINVTEETCRDILNLQCVQNNTNFKLNICKYMIQNKKYLDLAIDTFSDLVSEYPGICKDESYITIINEILKCIYYPLRDRIRVKIIDTLELLYALGNTRYLPEIVYLYKKNDTGINAKKYSPDNVHTKLALIAYSSTKYNAKDGLQKMYEIYKYIKRAKLNHLKGHVYYYHAIFYRRVNINEIYLPLKDHEIYSGNYTGCIQRAKRYGFWLADYATI